MSRIPPAHEDDTVFLFETKAYADMVKDYMEEKEKDHKTRVYYTIPAKVCYQGGESYHKYYLVIGTLRNQGQAESADIITQEEYAEFNNREE